MEQQIKVQPIVLDADNKEIDIFSSIPLSARLSIFDTLWTFWHFIPWTFIERFFCRSCDEEEEWAGEDEDDEEGWGEEEGGVGETHLEIEK